MTRGGGVVPPHAVVSMASTPWGFSRESMDDLSLYLCNQNWTDATAAKRRRHGDAMSSPAMLHMIPVARMFNRTTPHVEMA
jgi:hypothetical protein